MISAALVVGMGLLGVSAVYAGVWAWLRAGGFSPLNDTSPPSPLSKREGGLVSSSSSKTDLSLILETRTKISPPSLLERGLGGEVSASGENPLLFSVLVAARDEAAALPHLLRALAAQTLPPPCFEVLVADDHSTDGTAALVLAAARTVPFALRLIQLPPGQTGKKAALTAAEAQARAPWAACTDADCRPAPGWLLTMSEWAGPMSEWANERMSEEEAAMSEGVNERMSDELKAQEAEKAREVPTHSVTQSLSHSFTHSLTHFLSGPVRLTPGGAWFDGLLGLEFAGLGAVGAGCIARQQPTMCNGANLAFRRASFQEVGGYGAAGGASIASGDDEFLLHEMQRRYPDGVRFVADARAVVDTPAPATLGRLLAQRVRWASKYPHYRSAAPRRLALLVLSANLSLTLAAGLAAGWPALRPWAAAAAGLKLGADGLLLWPMLGLLGRRRWLGWLLPLQLLYAPYALAVALRARAGPYQWKSRTVR